ncbi:MAG: hypothetical protein GY795_30345 [Desulfobacterales bacterium]|nr:hypothetical protein [Desulfobacterales bacterium]
MNDFKHTIQNISFDNFVLGTIGLTSIIISVLSFIGWINLSTNQLLQMILVGIGLLLSVKITQSFRNANEMKQLCNSLGVSDISILNSKIAFPQSLEQKVFKANRFVLDTSMSYEKVIVGDDPQRAYKKILDKRLRQKKLSFKCVEIIYNKKRFEKVLLNLLTYEGLEYFIRIYDAPPVAIPILHIMSFDNEHFYVGGFFPAESPTDEFVLYVKNQNEIKYLLCEYWNELWQRAKPLNENNEIDWKELKRIASNCGMDEAEYEKTVSRCKQQAKKDGNSQ